MSAEEASARPVYPVWGARRLWSLWDMLELPVGKFLNVHERLVAIGQTIILHDGPKSLSFQEAVFQSVVKDADDFCTLCADMYLTVTHGAAQALCDELRRVGPPNALGIRTLNAVDFVRLQPAFSVLSGCLKHESISKVAILIAPSKAHLYASAGSMWGDEISERFRSTLYDITEAAKCLALDRSTAAVFHLMHVVEVGLRAVHACLGLQPPDNPSWGIWLKQIRDERVRRGDRTWSENDYFQDVYSSLDAIKDAHRDPTMHVQTIHTEEEAILIFEHTKGLMKKIASRMDESGNPKA
jgi:hypothetical protein